MGDTVLFEDEVNAAMSAALDNGLNVTALHNHFFFDHPKVYFMHIEGEGAVDKLAGAVRKVYDTIKNTRAANAQPKDSFGVKPLPDKNSITAAPLNEIFGTQGESKDGMVKFTIGRPAIMHGVNIGKDMGVNTWAAFAGSDDNAIVDGDFAVTEDELQPVLKSLLKDKINIVAIHQHMTHEEPRIMFFHYWGRGRAKDLANAIKGAVLVSGLLEGQLAVVKLSAPLSSKIACVALCCTGIVMVAAQSAAPLKLKQTIPLPGVEGRIDHFAFDLTGERLFVCALGNNTVEVLDLRNGKRAHSITGLGAPQGVGYVPEANRLFVANDKGGICKIYDGKSFQAVGELRFEDDADNVRYDETSQKIYVGFGSGGIAIVNAPDGKQVGSIKLSAHPEAFQLEKKGSRIFVNVPNSRHVAVVDRDKGEVVARWKTDLAFANFPMALDEADHRLFVGCRLPSKLVVLNTDSGDVVAKIDISGDCDDLFYDTKRHRVYAICGAGKIDVIDQIDPNTYRVSTTIRTADGARTGLFVSERDTLFVAIPHRGSQQAEVRCYQIE